MTIDPASRGYVYMSIFFKNTSLYLSAINFHSKTKIIYLAKSGETFNIYGNCDLVLSAPAENMLKFKYLVSNRQTINYDKITFNKIKLESLIEYNTVTI